MCGIAGIIVKQAGRFNLGEKIARMSAVIKHRGPDGEGFMAASPQHIRPYFGDTVQNYGRTDLHYIPKSGINNCEQDSFMAFAHRRLAIIDLGDTGHQPMCSASQKNWITFNGEIYNYIELKAELAGLGYRFISESDTEVILAAYEQWGQDCVNRFNGMWSFCIYDSVRQICFASRDRLGVKPFYYLDNENLFAFASEQKAFTASGLVEAKVNPKALHSYLANALLENESANFFDGITELWPGTNLVYDLTTKKVTSTLYYRLEEKLIASVDALSEHDLIDRINASLEHAVKIRLRSDVEVGTCLSGGIDSSALAVIISELTGKPVYCFTSVFKNRSFNEEHFADSVAQKIKARHYKIEPTLEGFISEVDALVYSQDVPIWSTSTYAQFKVMQLARQNNIKVVLDGQGADELFGGYHHHFIAKWNNLFSQGKRSEAFAEIKASAKTFPNPWLFFAKERLKQNYFFNEKQLSFLFKPDYLSAYKVKNPSVRINNLNTQLLSDIYDTRLKSFLKCEDRCGMWHSVESRTPFSDDVDLMTLLFSFDANKKIKNGVSKYLLREAVKDKLPPAIYARYDKKGFETPMQEWVNNMRPRILAEIKNAGFDFVNYKNLERTEPGNTFQNELLFKLYIFSRWQTVFKAVK